MNVVDSSGWIEYLRGGKNRLFFATPLEDTKSLLVPTLCVYEVGRKLNRQVGDRAAQEGLAAMRQGRLLNMDWDTAVGASQLSKELSLAMADSIILATARLHKAVLWTQDADFKNVTGVRYVPA